MKKAILIVGIIWTVLCFSGAIAEIITAIGQFVNLQGPEVTWQADPERGTINLILGIYLIVGGILSLVMINKRNSEMTKGAGITLGVFGIIFGADVPGVLFIVDSAINRKSSEQQ